MPFVANIKTLGVGGGVPDAPDGPIWNRPLRLRDKHHPVTTVGADSISARGPCRYRPRRGQAPLPTNQGKQPPKSKRSTTYTCGASALGGQNDGRQPAKLARSCGSMPHWGIDRCATPQRRPLQTNINGWHNCITTPLPIRYKLVHRTRTEYKICTSSTTDAQNIHKYTRF